MFILKISTLSCCMTSSVVTNGVLLLNEDDFCFLVNSEKISWAL